MKKKILMLLAILFLIFNSTAQTITTDDIFTKLIYNTDTCINDCYGIYEFCNPFDKDINLNSVTHKFLKGNLKKENPLMIEKTVNEEYNCITGTHLEETSYYHFNTSQEVCYNKIINDWGICNEEINDFVIMESDEEISYNQCVRLKISGNIGLNNSVEWIPEIKILGITYKQSKWAWWNSIVFSYRSRLENTTDNYSYVTPKVGGQYLHYLAGNSSYLYSTGAGVTGSYAVATNTTELHWFNSTDCLGNNPSGVYDKAGGVWCFDANSGNQTIDCSGNSNTGNCTNMGGGSGVTNCNWNSSGVFGTAITFDGTNDYINIPESSSLKPTIITVEIVLNIPAYKAGSYVYDFGGHTIIMIESANSFEPYFLVGEAWCPVWESYAGEVACPINTNCSIMATWNGSKFTAYVNGESKFEANCSGALGSGAGINTIAVNNGLDVYLNGSIGQIKLSNRSASATEAQEHHQNVIGNRSQLGAEETTIAPNAPPTISLNYPPDNSTNLSVSFSLNVTVIDPEGAMMNVTFYNGSGSVLCFNQSITNGSNVFCQWNDLNYNTTYEWSVNATDGEHITTSDIWNFTTLINFPPNISKIIPLDTANVLTPVTFKGYVSDDVGVKNVTLCIRKEASADWDYYLFNYSGLTNFNYTFSKSLMIGLTYYWDLYVCDNGSICGYSTEGNWSFHVYGLVTTTTTTSTTTTTIREDLLGGFMRIIYDDLTLGNHKITIYQRTNYTNSSGGEAWRYNYITSFSQRRTYVSHNERLGEGVEYLVKIQDQREDYISSPEKLQDTLFHNLGYIISALIIVILGIIIYKKIKK